MSVIGKVIVRLDFLESLAQDLGAKNYPLVKALSQLFTDGSGIGQVSKLYADSFSQAQSVNTDLDLNPGPTGAFGAVLFTTLKGIIVFAGAANPGDLIVGNVTNGIVAPFGAATHSQAVKPGGVYMNLNPTATGWPVSAGTADLLRIASAATSGTYTGDVILIGT
jgi:hypothetical protein